MTNNVIEELNEALQEYMKRFGEPAPVLGMDPQKALEAMRSSIAAGTPMEEGGEKDLPHETIL